MLRPWVDCPPVTLMQVPLATPPDSSSSHMTRGVADIFGGKIIYNKQSKYLSSISLFSNVLECLSDVVKHNRSTLLGLFIVETDHFW